jgi:hypothetical protein
LWVSSPFKRQRNLRDVKKAANRKAIHSEGYSSLQSTVQAVGPEDLYQDVIAPADPCRGRNYYQKFQMLGLTNNPERQ